MREIEKQFATAMIAVANCFYLHQPHLLYPHCLQITHPLSCSSAPPHSGQRAESSSGTSGVGLIASGSGSQFPRATCFSYSCSMTLAIASGQDVHFSPCCRIVDGQRIPLS